MLGRRGILTNRPAQGRSSMFSQCCFLFYLFSRLIQQRFKQTIVSARFGGPREATKRLLAQLPISAQSYSCSPYLDLSLFSYDDKWVSGMERPKACGEHPIRLVSFSFPKHLVTEDGTEDIYRSFLSSLDSTHEAQVSLSFVSMLVFLEKILPLQRASLQHLHFILLIHSQ